MVIQFQGACCRTSYLSPHLSRHGDTLHCQKHPWLRAWRHFALPKAPPCPGMRICCTAKNTPSFGHGDTLHRQVEFVSLGPSWRVDVGCCFSHSRILLLPLTPTPYPRGTYAFFMVIFPYPCGTYAFFMVIFPYPRGTYPFFMVIFPYPRSSYPFFMVIFPYPRGTYLFFMVIFPYPRSTCPFSWSYPLFDVLVLH